MGILTILIFHLFKDENMPLLGLFYILLNIVARLSGIITTKLEIYSIAALILIYLDNGKKGINVKYLFYVYYPLHLLVLALLWQNLN